jgi:EAL domain-containing protein (putative c-di-GMP-specific phosphodiesterase class I)
MTCVITPVPMSPLLSTRPSEAVLQRLLGACGFTALLALLIAVNSGDTGRPTAAAPTFVTAGAVCSALVAYLLFASARAVQDDRLRWMAAGVTIACAGLLATIAGQATIFPNGTPVNRSPDAGAARYLVWHASLASAAVLAVMGARPTRHRLAAFLGVSAALLAWSCIGEQPLGDLATSTGTYNAELKLLVGVCVVVQGGTAAAWWNLERRNTPWGAMCMIALLWLSAADSLFYLVATQPYEGSWWASIALRGGQFAVPAVGLVLGFVGFADKMRELQLEIEANFLAEGERAAREDELAGADRAHRERLAGRIRRLISGEGLDVALQPIVDLASGQVVGAEALARFTDADGRPIDTESCFLDAHGLELGTELELAAVRLALHSHDRLPEGIYLAINASPALLGGDELIPLLAAHDRGPLVIELTEHQAVEDYLSLERTLDELREHGVRVAIDDVGSGFSSFRHVTRVNPEILKLDRSLVCGIDDDPVRQSLAAAIVAFAADVGAVVVSEGIESEAELACLRGLAVGLGQGFFLGRPDMGAVATHAAERVA